MGIEKRVEATAKNIVGKLQEAVGELTGDQKTKVEGQIKQAEASTQHAKENIKDKAKRIIDRA